MVVLHTEPVLTLSFGGEDVMRRIEVHLVIKHTGGRISSKLITDHRVLGLCQQRQSQKRYE